jgi:hypothetical protein
VSWLGCYPHVAALLAGTFATEDTACRGIRVVLEHQQVHDDATAHAAGAQWARVVAAIRFLGALVAPFEPQTAFMSTAPPGAACLSTTTVGGESAL